MSVWKSDETLLSMEIIILKEMKLIFTTTVLHLRGPRF